MPGAIPDAMPDAIPPSDVRDIDILLVLDNSESMAEEHEVFANQLNSFVQILGTGDLNGDDIADFEPVRSIHFGVISTDMGTGAVPVATCGGDLFFGDDGILNRAGRGEGCRPVYPTPLRFMNWGGLAPETFAEDVSCVAHLGTEGCSVKQPLEAMLKALTPSTSDIGFWNVHPHDDLTPGHGDGANAGFLREGSLLVIIAATTEDDCSMEETTLFRSDGSSDFRGSLDLRCFRYPDTLQPVSRYVDGLLRLRPGAPDRLIYAPVAGIPTDLVNGTETLDFDAVLSDPRMIQRVDPEDSTRLAPSCVTALGASLPPRRMVSLAQQLAARGAGVALGSICGWDPSSVLNKIIERQPRF
jgi:hypothetical protein